MNTKTILFGIAGLLLLTGVIFTIRNISYETATKKIEREPVKKVLPPKVEFGIKIKDFIIESNEVESGATLSDILYPVGISYAEIDELIQSSQQIFNVRNLQPHHSYHFYFNDDSLKELRYFVYEIDKISYVKYDFLDSITAELGHRQIIRDTIVKEGVINSSLWLSMKKSGTDPNLALYLSDIYAWTIDFYGIQKGDKYKVVYVANLIDSVYIGIEKVIAARFTHSGNDFYAYRFMQDSVEDFFDENGGSLRRTFLKAPLKFTRISSRFSNNRLHHVYKIRRPHHGVDYAAPTGTPVRAIGDGKVTKAAWSGGYGRRVVIKHNSTYTTGYAHLSRYEAGIKAGVFVKQGQVIGYVGMSGTATGPHLDFRFYKNGKAVDPLKVKSPPAVPIKEENKKKFKNTIKLWNSILK